jgi:aminoglycoside phosphotransferase (APT) family kinase protein
VNAIYSLGERLCVRLPRHEQWSPGLDAESLWLPKLAPHLGLRIPKPLASGRATAAYPLPWAIYEWIDGRPYADHLIEDERRAARDLARFVIELRGIDPVVGAPAAGRRPLRELDADTRAAISAAGELITLDPAPADPAPADSAPGDRGPADRVRVAWQRALEAPAWTGSPVWIHGDLLRPNLLVQDGRIHAVIDFGSVGVGDPAADVIAAWTVFGREGREVFRAELEVDDGTWNRARGFALHQAAEIIPYYRESNPEFVELARRTIAEIIADQ